MGVFAYHLERLAAIAKENPGAVWRDGDAHDEKQDDELDAQSSGAGVVTYYRHPIKGTFRIDSFQTAMEIYGYLKSIGENAEAQIWWDFACENFPPTKA